MNFICQQSAISQLQELADHKRHSVLIEGVSGSGKTYLAKQYASMVGAEDFQIIDPTVKSIRSAIDTCYTLSSSIVLCIENLDSGVAAAAYALLKFLEEPASNVYLVVTCANMYKVPDTIVSRSVCVAAAPPTPADVTHYAIEKYPARYQELKATPLWNCVRSFKQADTVLSMTDNQVDYFTSLQSILGFDDNVSSITWKLGHYSDNTATPLDIVVSYVIEMSNSHHIKQAGMQCIKELAAGRVGAHAVLAKFVFECKYIQ